MDRRRFLSLFSAASAAAVFASSGFVESANSWMQLSNYDVQLLPPRGWLKYIGYEVTQAYSGDDMVLADGVEMPELSGAPTPILSFSQFAEPMEGFNPNIYICADRMEGTIDVMDMVQFAEEDFCSLVPAPARLVSPKPIRLNDFHAVTTLQSFQFETNYGLSVRAVRHLTAFAHRNILYGIMMFNDSNDRLLDEQLRFHDSISRIHA